MRNELYARNPKIVMHGTETTFFLSPKICTLIAENITNPSSLLCF